MFAQSTLIAKLCYGDLMSYTLQKGSVLRWLQCRNRMTMKIRPGVERPLVERVFLILWSLKYSD